MLQIPHEPIDQGVGILMALLGQVQIHHRRLQARMAHVLLDHPQIHPFLQ